MRTFRSASIVMTLCFLTFNLMAYDGLELNKLKKSTTNKSSNLIGKNKFGDDGIKKKFIVTPGLGFNLLAKSLLVKYNSRDHYYGFDANSGKSSPMYILGVDYGITKKFSAGVAFGFQKATIKINDAYGNYGWEDNWTRIHMAARADFHIISSEFISLYTGVKFGYNLYSMSTTASGYTASEYINRINVYPNPFTAQVHFGFNYYFKSIVGANVEAGLGYGGPYLVAVGVSIKLSK